MNWCKLIGHKWRPAHRADVLRGKAVWVYTDHVCERCYRMEVRYPAPPTPFDEQPESASSAEVRNATVPR